MGSRDQLLATPSNPGTSINVNRKNVMTKNAVAMVCVAVVLAGIYIYYFTDLINPPIIQIISQSRPVAPQRWSRSRVQPVSFKLDGKYRLTSLKVVALESYRTNKYAIPVWHLVSPSNSVPINGFIYGMSIQGMKPAKTNTRPDRLEPDHTYRIIIEAGRARGHDDFKTSSQLPP